MTRGLKVLAVGPVGVERLKVAMEYGWIHVLIEWICDQGGADRCQFVGMTELEMRALETALGAPLPRLYRDFLLGMGRKADDVFADVEIAFEGIEQILELQDRWRDTIQRWESQEGRSRWFVFASYLDFQCAYFRLDAPGDDPDVFRCIEGIGAGDVQGLAPHEDIGKFSHFIASLAENYVGRKNR